VRAVTFASDRGPRAAVPLGEEIVPVSALAAPATSVRELFEALAEAGREIPAAPMWFASDVRAG